MAQGKQRDRNKEAMWRSRIREQRDSGQSIRRYCAKHSLSESGFHWWRRELAARDHASGSESRNGQTHAPFAEVRVVPNGLTNAFSSTEYEPVSTAIEICLSGSMRLRVRPGFDGPTLARVIELLEGGWRC